MEYLYIFYILSAIQFWVGLFVTPSSNTIIKVIHYGLLYRTYLIQTATSASFNKRCQPSGHKSFTKWCLHRSDKWRILTSRILYQTFRFSLIRRFSLTLTHLTMLACLRCIYLNRRSFQQPTSILKPGNDLASALQRSENTDPWTGRH